MSAAAAKAKAEIEAKFFLPYQQRWILDGSRLKLMEKARQIGLSWATAYRSVRVTAHKGNRLDTWVSSRDDLQARLYLEDCRKFAEIFNLAATDLGERLLDGGKISAYVLEFANRQRLHSLSSNPDAQAGKRGRRILDEFALHPDPRKLYSIAYPGITWGGELEIISTHRGSQNFFNELVREVREKGNPKGISLHRVTLQDALDQGFLAKLKAKLPEADPRQAMDDAAYFDYIRASCADEESFQQEYMCNPADDSAAFLSYDLIAGCEYGEGESWERSLAELADSGNELYVGADIGRTQDLTVFWVTERAGGVHLTRKIVTLRNTPFATQEAMLWEILGLPRVRRACLDASGLGRQLAERARARFGWRVEPVTFTAGVKEELAYPVRAAFEDRSIRIPFDKHVRSDLRSLTKSTTAAGNVRFTAERTKEGHADRFWALALALHAAKPGVANYRAALA